MIPFSVSFAFGMAALVAAAVRWLFEDGCRDAYRSALEAEAGWREEAGGPRAVPGAER